MATNAEEVEVLKRLNRLPDTLPSIGLKMKTGLTVDFRNREALRDHVEANAVPLFYSQHIKSGKVEFPIGKESEYLVTEQNGLCRKIQTIFCQTVYSKGRTSETTVRCLFGSPSTRNMTKLAHRTRLILSAASMNYLSALYMACMCCLIPHRMTVTIEF